MLRGESFVYIPAHPLLSPYISNYTVTFPEKTMMTDQYTIMPSASSTLVYSSVDHTIESGVRGVSTKSCVVGREANRFTFLLLIEFHPGGFYPFFKINQHELQDVAINFCDICMSLDIQIKDAVMRYNSINELVQFLNVTLLSYLQNTKHESVLLAAMDFIIKNSGIAKVGELSHAVNYSEKQINRWFKQYVGTSVKTFSRIVRVNKILRLMEHMDGTMTQLAQVGSYFDQSHFIHDFKSICGVSPHDYLRNKSIFYNEVFKL